MSGIINKRSIIDISGYNEEPMNKKTRFGSSFDLFDSYEQVKRESVKWYIKNSKEYIECNGISIPPRIDINIKRPNTDDTLLRDAVKEGKFGLCKFLVKNGADVNAKVSYGKYRSPLCWSLLCCPSSEYQKCTMFLIKNGADLKYSLQSNVNILSKYKNGNPFMYDFLIEKSIEFCLDYDRLDSEGETLLCHAARNGNIRFCKTLVEAGASIVIGRKRAFDFASTNLIYNFLVDRVAISPAYSPPSPLFFLRTPPSPSSPVHVIRGFFR